MWQSRRAIRRHLTAEFTEKAAEKGKIKALISCGGVGHVVKKS
jgi:hypothetical protein